MHTDEATQLHYLLQCRGKKDYYLVQVLADLEGQGWAMPPRLADLGQWEPLIIYSVSEKMCQLWQVVVSTRVD